METSKLIGPTLDWAVAKAAGIVYARGNHIKVDGFIYPRPDYSTDWRYGGPIIEREEIFLSVTGSDNYKWGATSCGNDGYGPTPLIAAMRCYVASKLGDEIEIPEELK